MKFLAIVALAVAFAALPVKADQSFAQKKNCLGCHAIDRKIVGPAYKDVAKKYAGQDVTAALASKIIQGGKGTWGVIPMPANPQVNQAEAQALVKWVLSQK